MSYTLSASGAVLYLAFDEPLTTNREYKITLSAGISGTYGSGVYELEDDYVFWFTSTYCPLFTTLTKVKLQAGPSVDAFLDDTIYRMIHKNSLDAVDLSNTYRGTSYAYDYWGCTWHSVPHILRLYTECKTAYDLLALIDLAAQGGDVGAGGQLKTLGDMTIKYTGGVSAKAGDPSRKKQLYDCWNEMLRAIRTRGALTAVRGWYDTTKGFSHPTWDANHNRVIRTVNFNGFDPAGPWTDSDDWRDKT